MSRLIILILAIASVGSFSSTSFAQTVATGPVGFTKVTIPAAPNATTPSNSVVSTPFAATAAFAGSIASLDSPNSFTISGAAFTANQFIGTLSPTEKPPYLVRLKTGNNTGRFFLITAHDSNTLTVNPQGYTFVSGAPANASQIQVSAGNLVEIFPANTLNSLFPSGNPFFKNASVNSADNVYLFNGTKWEVFFHNGTSWRKSGNGLVQNNAIVYPDDGIFIVRRQTTSLDLTFLGAVSTTAERTDIPGPGSTYISNRFAVGTKMIDTNIQNLPGWKKDTSVNDADNVLLWNPANSTWRTYFHNGTSWRRSGSGLSTDNDVVPINGALFVIRRSTAAGSQSTLTQPLPYTLN